MVQGKLVRAHVYPGGGLSSAPYLCGRLLSVGLSLKVVATVLHVYVLCAISKGVGVRALSRVPMCVYVHL